MRGSKTVVFVELGIVLGVFETDRIVLSDSLAVGDREAPL